MVRDRLAARAELTRLPLFAAFSSKQLDDLLDSARILHLNKGETLFNQGEEASHFFLVRHGQIKLYRVSDVGMEKVFEIVYAGQTFAEALSFSPEPAGYPVNAEAIADSEVLVLNNATFARLLRSSVDTCFRVMGAMSQRMHGLINEIDNLTLRDASFRIIAFLLSRIPCEVESGVEEIHLPSTKSLIAARLSIKPETFSRILARLTQQGLIEVKGAEVALLDIAALRQTLRQDNHN